MTTTESPRDSLPKNVSEKMNNVTASRVSNTQKPITSRTGLNRATKARETLATAQAILLRSEGHHVADAIQPYIDQLSHQIANYYRSSNANTRSSDT
jgi:hypothetical protein